MTLKSEIESEFEEVLNLLTEYAELAEQIRQVPGIPKWANDAAVWIGKRLEKAKETIRNSSMTPHEKATLIRQLTEEVGKESQRLMSITHGGGFNN